MLQRTQFLWRVKRTVSTIKQVLRSLACSKPASSHPSLGNSRLPALRKNPRTSIWHLLDERVLAEWVLAEWVLFRSTLASTQNHHLRCPRNPRQPTCIRISGVLEWVIPHSSDHSTSNRHLQCSHSLAPQPNHTRRDLLE